MVSLKAGSRPTSRTVSDDTKATLPRPLATLVQELRDRGVGMMDYEVAPEYWGPSWELPALETGVYSLDGEPTRDVLLRQMRTKLVVTDLPGIYRFGIGSAMPWVNAHQTARGRLIPEVSLFVSRSTGRDRHCRFAAELAYFAKTLGGLDLTAHKDNYFVVVSGKALGVVSGFPTGTALGPYSRAALNDAVTTPTQVDPAGILPCFRKLGWLTKGLSEFWQEYLALLSVALSLAPEPLRVQRNKDWGAEVYERLGRPMAAVPVHTARSVKKSAIIQGLEIAKSDNASWKADALFQCLVPAAYSRQEFHNSLLTKSQLEARVTRAEVWEAVAAALESKLGEIHDGRFG